MKLKKIIASTLLIGFMCLDVTPTFSIENKESKQTTVKLTKKQKKAMKDKQSKIDYINLDWWEDFNDEYLNSYILKAIENNYDLKIATLKVEEARQSVKVQFASELPNLYVGASPAITKMPGARSTEGNFSIPMIASYEIDIFLKNHDKTKSIKKLYEASQLSEKATTIAIASAVGSTYYNIVKADKLIEIQTQIVSDRKQIFELMKLRNEQGITSTSDLVQAEKAYILSETDLVE